LAVTLLAASRIGRSPLAAPLALLCLCMFGWNLAAVGHAVSGHVGFRLLDVALSPFTTPLAVSLVVRFVGISRRMRVPLVVYFAIAAALSVAAVVGLSQAQEPSVAASAVWAKAHLAMAVPGAIAAGALLVRHAVRVSSAEEQLRARMVLAALVVGAAFGMTELWADAGVPIVRLGHAATLASAVILAVVALRLRLLEESPSAVVVVLSVSAAAVAVLFYVMVFRLFGASTSMVVVGVSLVTAVLVLVLRQVVAGAAEHRSRRQRLALLGRLSAQMAHDLKTPLGAIKGAAEYLQEERRRGCSIDAQGEFLDLLVGEAERLSRLVDKYRRLGDLSLERDEHSINDLLVAVVARRSVGGGACEYHTELDPAVPPCAVDADLLAVAVESVIDNGVQAMDGAGVLTVRTELVEAPEGVAVSIADTGVGMDARQAERALDEFFTTRAMGSGLGLPFARRVVEAHGGELSLSSDVGRGTVVRMFIPRAG
jgi:signal transduction histidine kinase